MNPFSFDVSSILAGPLDGEDTALYRVVGHFFESEPMSTWLLRVYLEDVPSGARDLSCHNPGFLESQLGEKLRLVAECIHKTVDLSELSDKDVAVLRQRQNTLGWLLDENLRLAILQKKSRGELLKQRAIEIGVPHTDLYPLLFLFLRNGMGTDALLPRRGGGAAKPRLNGSHKMGRPNAFAQENSKSNLRGHIRTTESQKKIEEAATLMSKHGLTYNAAWLQIFGDDNDAPSQSTFYKQTRAVIQKERMIADLVGNEFYRDHIQTYLSDQVPDRVLPGDRFTADGSPGKFQLVSATNRRKRIGNPLLIIVIDEASEYIVSVFATLQAESWATYKKAVLMAFTPKQEAMKALGMPEGTLRLYAKCRSLSVDRGPANSLQAQRTLCDRLRIHHLPCPPGQPRARAIGESINNAIHRYLSIHSGGSTRGRKPHEIRRARRARRNARYSLKEYWIRAIAFAEVWNKTANVSHLYTSEMGKVNTPQSPEGIMEWGLKLRRGAQLKQLNHDELYRELLDELPPRKMRIDGIHLNNAVFSSSAYRTDRDSRVASQYGTNKTDPSVTPYRDSYDPDCLYYAGPSGALIRVWRRGKEGRWEGHLPEEIDALGYLSRQSRKESIRRQTRRRRVDASVRRSVKEAIGEIARNILIPSSRESIRKNRFSESKMEANENRDESRKRMDRFMSRQRLSSEGQKSESAGPLEKKESQNLLQEEANPRETEESRLSNKRFLRNFQSILNPAYAKSGKRISRT